MVSLLMGDCALRYCPLVSLYLLEGRVTVLTCDLVVGGQVPTRLCQKNSRSEGLETVRRVVEVLGAAVSAPGVPDSTAASGGFCAGAGARVENWGGITNPPVE